MQLTQAAAAAASAQFRSKRSSRAAQRRAGPVGVKMSAGLEPKTDGSEEVSIRRRRPAGANKLECGPTFDFLMETVDKDGKYVENTDNRPRNILEEIVWYKDTEIAQFKEVESLASLKKKADLARTTCGAEAQAEPTRDFVGALRAMQKSWGQPGLIAEVKKASPSKGVIQPNFDPVRIAKGYEAGGAACLSVLTDAKFFQGGFENLTLIRKAGVKCPLLCKEFIVEPYQIYKARVAGADAILLIAAVLPNQDLKYLMAIAKSLSLQCLIEVHTEAEMERVLRLPGVEMLGINNRDLGTFKVDLQLTCRLLETAPGRKAHADGVLVVGESGIFTKEDVAVMQGVGVGAILVGESIVKQDDPETGVKKLYGRA